MATELLNQLRNHEEGILSVIADRNYSRAMDLLIEHREEFPIRIQEKIQELIDDRENVPATFFGKVESACIELFTAAEREGQPWRGLDSVTDTQEQVEVAVRFFPNVLNEWRLGVTPSGAERLWHSSFWVSACERSLPFAPLLVVLAFELEEFLGRFNPKLRFRRWSFAREFLLDNYSPALVDDEYDKRFDELTLSTFQQLITKNLIQKGSDEVFNFCSAAIKLRPARIERTLLYLIDWVHDLGFLFHNQYQPMHAKSCIYSMLTHRLGTEQVRNIVLDVIRRTTRDYTTTAIRSFVGREDIAAEAINLLIQSDDKDDSTFGRGNEADVLVDETPKDRSKDCAAREPSSALGKRKITLSPNDIIFGRNPKFRHHAGNKRLLLLIKKDADEYLHEGTTKKRRTDIAENIVNILSEENVRFLRVGKEVKSRPITDFEYEEIDSPEEKKGAVTSKFRNRRKKGKNRSSRA